MADLTEAILIATQAHREQRCKAGEPYIMHPIRVMLAGQSEDERIVGILHDVVEDTLVTLEDLGERGFSAQVIAGVDALTKRPGEDYMTFVTRCKADPIARRVKLADLADNMNLDRLPNPQQKDFERLLKYRQARAFLLAD